MEHISADGHLSGDRAEQRVALGRDGSDHTRNALFVQFGTPTEFYDEAALSGLLVLAELPSVRFHDLRHTAATLLLAQKVDPRTIMETLGHSQISLTLNTYSHVLPALQKDAAAKLDAVLGGT